MDILYPNYENSIVSLANSILKHWGLPVNNPTLALADKFFEKNYTNIVVMLLDGMGKCIIDRNLEAEGFFGTHTAGTYSSTFPPTTTAATTSLNSGLMPCEHGWLGWDCYFPQIDRNVTLFHNTDTETKEEVSNENIAMKYCPYNSVVDRINTAGQAYAVAPFLPSGPKTFEESCNLIKEYCAKPGKKYIYCYSGEPDKIMHDTGCYSPKTMQVLAGLERAVENLAAALEDTLLIITADHGHVDSRNVCIKSYPKIMNCLKRIPTIEPRALNFFVKEGEHSRFEEEFQKEFGNKFHLLPKAKVLEMKLFGHGKEHKDFQDMLGDYLAVAINDLSIFRTQKQVESFKSIHAGLTRDEMIIPLIIVEIK